MSFLDWIWLVVALVIICTTPLWALALGDIVGWLFDA